MRRYVTFAALGLLALAGFRLAGQPADNAARPGEPTLEVPTLVCLGVRCPVAGDANGNATVALDYRRVGETEWRGALPLFRCETAALLRKPAEGVALFAGSVFDLRPDTDYELRLRLTDPDGGSVTRTLRAHTRAEPQAAPDARIVHVKPGNGGGSGTEADPYLGLDSAQAAAEPGDLMLLHAGVYPGTWSVTKSGESGRPIVWRGAGDGESVIDGGGAERALSANGMHHVYFEGLSVRNARWGIVAHEAADLVIRRCHFYDLESGFTATRDAPHMLRFFFADNTVDGRCTWPRSKGIEPNEGFELAGEGHVVCYNRIRGCADGISIREGQPSSAIDIYNNELSECTDDGIELDYGEQNIRCFRNRLTNCFMGISTQPLYAGPCYIFRNALYNIGLETFKLHNGVSGVLAYHNTSVKQGMALIVYTGETVSNSVFRNNLFLGSDGNYAMELTSPMRDCDFDYNGFAGGPFRLFAKWNDVRYATLDDVQKSGALEAHGVWAEAGACFASGVGAPSELARQFEVAVNDLRLAQNSGAVDKGAALPNINDGFAGAAPDLGAYEYGSQLDHYGPRPTKGR